MEWRHLRSMLYHLTSCPAPLFSKLNAYNYYSIPLKSISLEEPSSSFSKLGCFLCLLDRVGGQAGRWVGEESKQCALPQKSCIFLLLLLVHFSCLRSSEFQPEKREHSNHGLALTCFEIYLHICFPVLRFFPSKRAFSTQW